jgi:NAD(P)-dependent dehydrogenase (short-subunit alcohol dehydrogenase family)
MPEIKGQVVVVTGGSRGIGAGIVRAFVDAGAMVAFNGRAKASGEALAEELGAPDRVWFRQGSAIVREDLSALIDGAVERFGKLDVLVNNVGGSSATKLVVDLTEQEWDDDLRLNLTSTFLATQIALGHMLPAKYGSIINISSVEGKQGTAAMSVYCTAKHGVNGFTKSVAAEVGRQGVTVNAICPGLILTDQVMEGGPVLAKSLGMTFDEMVENVFKSQTMTGELNTVEQVAELALVLAGPAGRGITGAQLSVDGGIATY